MTTLLPESCRDKGSGEMTERELHRLRRAELLELLLEMRKELDAVNRENEALREQLEAVQETRELAQKILHTVQETAAQIQVLVPKEQDVQSEQKSEQ